ncbi:microtubule associated protein [Phlyctema vagabunda]|uniref:Microtubule associated protein n=1 Tax=Phlyctema vagabunda TaxID=108571 RepID=A0ABR4PSB6_9HELO
MVQAGVGGLDTPRTNIGDATYLNQPDFDISQEQSFQSPSKDNNNLLNHLKNGRHGAGGVNLRTPRSRAVFSDRKNLPVGLSGGEFTPMLKSATRNSTLRRGKENGVPQTPAFLKPGGLDNVPEELTPLPAMGSSIYGQDSRNGTYMAGTPMPQIESSSAASTPVAFLPRRNEGPGVLQDGNQLSLREQENVIDKIEKENFGLKLKIHFLEEALRKAGPGFSEAALKENTELKVDKVTMQKELHRYRKTLGAAERDVELYREKIKEMQDNVKRKHMDEGQREELDRLRRSLDAKEVEIEQLQAQVDSADQQDEQVGLIQARISDLQDDMREKERVIDDRDDEIDELNAKLMDQTNKAADAEEALNEAQQHVEELKKQSRSSEELAEARDTIEDFERELRSLHDELDEAKKEKRNAFTERDRAQADLEELQDEMANKSVTTKGLSRQIEEKTNRLQDDLEDLRQKHIILETQEASKSRDILKLQRTIETLVHDKDEQEQRLRDQLETAANARLTAIRERDHLSENLDFVQRALQEKNEEKELLQIRHDALTSESASLQRDLARSRTTIEELEDKIDHEKTLALSNERDVRDQYKNEIDNLNDELDDLRAGVREKQRMFDDARDKWDEEKRKLKAEIEKAEEQAARLQQTIDTLHQTEGTLSGNEAKLQQMLHSEKTRHEAAETLLNQQIIQLKEELRDCQENLEKSRSQVSDTRENLRISQREQKLLVEKVEGLEDEIEILQNSLEDESDHARQDLETVLQESEQLKKQLREANADLEKAESSGNKDLQEQLTTRLRDAEAQTMKVLQDKQALQDQLSNISIQMHDIRSLLTKAEAERDEANIRLGAMQEQEEETFQLDQERVNLRTAKAKLDVEVRRLREENRITKEQWQTTKQQLQGQLDGAHAEEDRLSAEIHDLKAKMKSSSGHDLASAKKTIKKLEDRIHELEEFAAGDMYTDAAGQIESARLSLLSARKKETEFLQREGAQKEILKGLVRQIKELERRGLNEQDFSQLSTASPSIKGSARKQAERDTARRLQETSHELQAELNAIESERDALQLDLEDAIFEKEQLISKNTTAESTITRLRSKIERLEKELQSERLNTGEDRTMALERRDLHEMLRETQVQAETLEVVLKERERTIAAANASEEELRTKLERVRDERTLHRNRFTSVQEQLVSLEKQFKRAKESWEEEKRNLTRGVRFPNMSMSEAGNESMIKQAVEKREVRHNKELRGLAMQIEYLRACLIREQNLRASAAHIKSLLQGKINFFKACNKADLKLLGVAPRVQVPKKKTLKVMGKMVIATVRMKKMAEDWQKNRAINEKLQACLKEMRRKQGRKSSGNV